MRKVTIWLVGSIVAAGMVVFLAWASSPDPKHNPATFEQEPVELSLAPAGQAVTLAQYRTPNGEITTLAVQAYDGVRVVGIDLAELGAPRTSDPFQALAVTDLEASTARAVQPVSVPVEDLLPAGPPGARHVGIGTNFPEHAEESDSDSVFNFPKFGRATPARTEVETHQGVLLDYEVELCMRFDRDVATLQDFDAARKGIFLCGDFTNRTALVELADPDNLDSGYGFSDAKSGPDFFPTGPFLVVPRDWKAFVAQARMATAINGEPRQDARGGEMILDFRQLAENALADMSEPRFLYDGEFYHLAPSGSITRNMTLMSGTSEGVIFTAPTRHDFIEAGLAYLFTGALFDGRSPMDVAKKVFVENETSSGHFLKPGDSVAYRSNVLGEIVVAVVERD